MSAQTTVLLVAGSPSLQSRSAVLLDAVGQRLAGWDGVAVDRLNIRELPAEPLLLAEWEHPAISHAMAQVAQARAVVVATPVYKAAYSGLLKLLFDLLPQTALKDKIVLPLATGGSPHHMLALDYALRPMLQSMAARHILPGVYATDAQLSLSANAGYELRNDIVLRLDEAVEALRTEVFPRLAATAFEPVQFSRVRCSV